MYGHKRVQRKPLHHDKGYAGDVSPRVQVTGGCMTMWTLRARRQCWRSSQLGVKPKNRDPGADDILRQVLALSPNPSTVNTVKQQGQCPM